MAVIMIMYTHSVLQLVFPVSTATRVVVSRVIPNVVLWRHLSAESVLIKR